jgi:hypothetical protein
MQSVQTEGCCSLVGATVWNLEVLMTALQGDYPGMGNPFGDAISTLRVQGNGAPWLR